MVDEAQGVRGVRGGGGEGKGAKKASESAERTNAVYRAEEEEEDPYFWDGRRRRRKIGKWGYFRSRNRIKQSGYYTIALCEAVHVPYSRIYHLFLVEAICKFPSFLLSALFPSSLLHFITFPLFPLLLLLLLPTSSLPHFPSTFLTKKQPRRRRRRMKGTSPSILLEKLFVCARPYSGEEEREKTSRVGVFSLLPLSAAVWLRLS